MASTRGGGGGEFLANDAVRTATPPPVDITQSVLLQILVLLNQ